MIEPSREHTDSRGGDGSGGEWRLYKWSETLLQYNHEWANNITLYYSIIRMRDGCVVLYYYYYCIRYLPLRVLEKKKNETTVSPNREINEHRLHAVLEVAAITCISIRGLNHILIIFIIYIYNNNFGTA